MQKHINKLEDIRLEVRQQVTTEHNKLVGDDVKTIRKMVELEHKEKRINDKINELIRELRWL